jgi:hypothetical protein
VLSSAGDHLDIDEPPASVPPTDFRVRWVTKTRVGLPAAINAGILRGAKTIAATLLDLLTEPVLLRQAQDEFVERTGGGTNWVAPLLLKDFAPPVDLRWPEYIQTALGKEWWIPTPAAGATAGDPRGSRRWTPPNANANRLPSRQSALQERITDSAHAVASTALTRGVPPCKGPR